MFGEKGEALRITDPRSNYSASTILDKECSFEGKMTFEGSVTINGNFKGEIFSDGQLIVGEGGSVVGQIEIGSILIEGEVKGNIKASQKIEINAPAVVEGDITAPSLIIKEGAVFDGNCSMGTNHRKNVVGLAKSSDLFNHTQ